MSTFNPLIELQDQICYVQCGFCTTLLLVNVPCSSLLKVVTVRCGHCTGHLAVNLTRASPVPVQLLAPLNGNEHKEDLYEEGEDSKVPPPNRQSPLVISSDNEQEEEEEDEDEDTMPMNLTINKRITPEKRQRAPSAYNQFIREEIQRLKSTDPNINHKQAFGTAAKNWALYPRLDHQLDGESCSYDGARKIDKKPRC